MSHSLLKQSRKLILSTMISCRHFGIIQNKCRENSNLKIASTKILFIEKRLNQTSSICWKCGLKRTESSKLFCEQCNFIQNPSESDNYFKIMDLDEKFNIDDKLLKDKYKKMQNLLHPDKFSNKSAQEKEISADFSSLVNKAYNNLQMPLKRAEHLLHLKGEEIKENLTVDDPLFLMEIMELNEEVENADEATLRQIDLKNKNELEKIAKQIDECFKNEDIKLAKLYIVKMKYYTSLGNRINSIMRELGIVD